MSQSPHACPRGARLVAGVVHGLHIHPHATLHTYPPGTHIPSNITRLPVIIPASCLCVALSWKAASAFKPEQGASPGAEWGRDTSFWKRLRLPPVQQIEQPHGHSATSALQAGGACHVRVAVHIQSHACMTDPSRLQLDTQTQYEPHDGACMWTPTAISRIHSHKGRLQMVPSRKLESIAHLGADSMLKTASTKHTSP